jgi:hypothetical protein
MHAAGEFALTCSGTTTIAAFAAMNVTDHRVKFATTFSANQ